VRGAVFLLVFLPALLAVFLLWGPGRDTKKSTLRRTSEEEQEDREPSRGVSDTPFAGTEGSGTFFIRFSKVRIDGREETYPSTYYWLKKWKKLPREKIFSAEKVLVIRNPRPKSAEDLANIFTIVTAEDAEARFRKMEEARSRTSNISADRARFLGAERIEDAQDIELEGHVAGRIIGAGRQGATTFDAARLDLHFDGNELQRLHFPKQFELRNDRVEIEGEGFDLRQGQEELRLDRAKRLKLLRSDGDGVAQTLMTLTSAGSLTFRPERIAGPSKDLFRSFDPGAGAFEGEGGVRLVLDEMEVRAEKFRGRHERGEDDRPRLRELFLDGGVRFEGREGWIVGQRARFDLDEGEIVAARIEGEGTRIAWGPPPPGEEQESYDVVAESDTGIVLKRGLTAEKKTDDLRLEMRQGVRMTVSRSPVGAFLATGDELSVRLRRFEVSGEAEAQPKGRLQLEQIHIRGGLRAEGDEIDLIAREITQDFDHDDRGRATGRRLELRGPAKLKHRPAAPEGRVAHTLALSATKRVALFESASPFAPLEAEGSGAVVVEWQRGDASPTRAQAEVAKVVILHPEAAKEMRSRLARMVLTGKVIVDGHQGHGLRGEHLDLRDGGRFFRIESPAEGDSLSRLIYIDGERKQVLDASKIQWDENTNRLLAEGRVEADLVFPSLVLTGEDRRRRRAARANLEDDPTRDRAWHLEAARVEAQFTGALPVLERNAADAKVPKTQRLRDVAAEGAVTLSSPGQKIVAREIFLDPTRKTGWASGAPLVVTLEDRLGDEVHQNRLESDRMDLRPEWTLLQGHSDVLLHVVSREVALDGKVSEKIERLHVACDKEVILKPRVAFFSGHTIFDRGDPEQGGFRISADKAFAYLADAPGKKSLDMKRLDRVEGLGHVDLRWNELRGRGDKVTYLVGPGKVLLEAKKGSRCTMDFRGNTSRAKALTYDQKKRRIETGDTQGVFNRPPR
jgi:hypothetical protein